MFKEYREATNEMEANLAIRIMRKKIETMQENLGILEQPYHERMKVAAKEITIAVLEQQKSVTLFNIEAKYSKASGRPKWKSVAMEFDPSEELIKRFTGMGKPSVSIKILKD